MVRRPVFDGLFDLPFRTVLTASRINRKRSAIFWERVGPELLKRGTCRVKRQICWLVLSLPLEQCSKWPGSHFAVV